LAGPRVPLPTLRLRPCGHRRMTEGQGGSLDLSCAALASATPCRFIPALTPTPFSSQLFWSRPPFTMAVRGARSTIIRPRAQQATHSHKLAKMVSIVIGDEER